MNSSIQENNTKNIYYGGSKVYQRPIIKEYEEIPSTGKVTRGNSVIVAKLFRWYILTPHWNRQYIVGIAKLFHRYAK